MQEVFKAGKVKRAECLAPQSLETTITVMKRVTPAFEASLKKLQLDYGDPISLPHPRPSTWETSKTRGMEAAM